MNSWTDNRIGRGDEPPIIRVPATAGRWEDGATGDTVTELPMFPLGNVLVPQMVLPLHVFEPRYRALMDDVLAGDGTFGVVLIERGSEVGGGDVRTEIGTRARLLKAEQLDDGRWVAIAVGTSRFSVRAWLPDDPYPRAVVEDLHDTPPGPEAPELRDAVVVRLRSVLALRAILEEGPADLDDVPLARDPSMASFQAVTLSQLSPLDAQRVLATDGVTRRLRLLVGLLDDLTDVLHFRIGNG